MFKLFVDGVQFAEEEDFGNAMELMAVLEETMLRTNVDRVSACRDARVVDQGRRSCRKD